MSRKKEKFVDIFVFGIWEFLVNYCDFVCVNFVLYVGLVENFKFSVNPSYTKPSSSTLFTKVGSSEDPMFFFCNFSTV